ncbi:MAG: hypothetical protein IPG73_08195 [Ignavibacteria bacterium]|nr:hypothetical protein [Ignavibacteria bacterium]
MHDPDHSLQDYSLEVVGKDLFLNHAITENSIAHVSVFNLVGMKISSSEQTIDHGSTATRVVQPG